MKTTNVKASCLRAGTNKEYKRAVSKKEAEAFPGSGEVHSGKCLNGESEVDRDRLARLSGHA